MTGKLWLWAVYVLQAMSVFFGFIPFIAAFALWIVKAGDMESAVLGGAHRGWQNTIFWIAFLASIAIMLFASMGLGGFIALARFFIVLGCVAYGMLCLAINRAPPSIGRG